MIRTRFTEEPYNDYFTINCDTQKEMADAVKSIRTLGYSIRQIFLRGRYAIDFNAPEYKTLSQKWKETAEDTMWHGAVKQIDVRNGRVYLFAEQGERMKRITLPKEFHRQHNTNNYTFEVYVD